MKLLGHRVTQYLHKKEHTYENHAIEKQIKNKKSKKNHKKQKNHKNKNKNGAGKTNYYSTKDNQSSLNKKWKNKPISLRGALNSYRPVTPNLVPVLVVMIKTGKGKFSPVLCLLDSGSSHSLLVINALPKTDAIMVENRRKESWSTKAGSFQTIGKAKVRFMLPEFSTKPKFEYCLYIDSRSRREACGPFYMVLGREFLQEFGFNIRFSTWDIEHDGATV